MVVRVEKRHSKLVAPLCCERQARPQDRHEKKAHLKKRRFLSAGSSRSRSGLPRMRLDQNSVLSLPNTGVSLALDLGDNGRDPWTPPSGRHGGIHPRNKTEVAR